MLWLIFAWLAFPLAALADDAAGGSATYPYKPCADCRSYLLKISYAKHDDNTDSVITSAALLDVETKRVLQVLPDLRNQTYKAYAFEGDFALDLNFDGYLDLEIFTDSFTGTNMACAHYLFDQPSGKLSYIASDFCLAPDPEKRRISEKSTSSYGAYGSVNTYIWQGKKRLLVESFTWEPDPLASKEQPYNYTTLHRRVDGRMKKIGTFRLESNSPNGLDIEAIKN